MENSFQTSFIPKKPITSSVLEKEPRSLFSIISIFILVVSILMAVGLFVYKTYLIKQQATLSDSLLLTRDGFEKESIDELELFDRRTESAKKILGNHVVLSPMFALLGEITIPSIQYTNFEFQTSKEKGFVVNIVGIASDYKSIALQSDVFSNEKSHSFKNVLFSDLIKDKNNNVNFNLTFNVDQSLLSYEKNASVSNVEINTNPASAPVSSTPTNPLLENVGNTTQ